MSATLAQQYHNINLSHVFDTVATAKSKGMCLIINYCQHNILQNERPGASGVGPNGLTLPSVTAELVFRPSPLVKIQYIGEPSGPRDRVLHLRQSGLGIELSSRGSIEPVWTLCAQKWPKIRFVHFSAAQVFKTEKGHIFQHVNIRRILQYINPFAGYNIIYS